MCRAEYLNYLRVREWQELESQLRQVAKQLELDGRRRRADEPDADGIHQALLSGLLSHIGLRDAERARLPRRPRHPVLDLPRAPGCSGSSRSS